MNKWIDIKVSYPKKNSMVLVYRGDNTLLPDSSRMNVAAYLGDGIFTWTCVTHWMYLPEPPKGS